MSVEALVAQSQPVDVEFGSEPVEVTIGGNGISGHPQLTGRDNADQHPASSITVDPSGLVVVTTTDVQAALAELDGGMLPLAGGTMTGAATMPSFQELSGESPDGWPLIPWVPGSPPSSTVAGPASLIFPNSDGGTNPIVMYHHRGHLVLGLADDTNALGYGAGAIIPTITFGSQTTSGITFPTGWRFNNDPASSGSTLNPYDSGIRTGYGTGMFLTADNTGSAFGGNTKVFSWSPTGLLVPAASAAIVPLTVQGAASQTANLQEWKTSAGVVLLGVNPAGFLDFILANATDAVIASKKTGDSNYRFASDAAGAMYWGSGSGPADTNLYRSAADTLKTDDGLVVTKTLETQAAVMEGVNTVAASGTTETLNLADGTVHDVTLDNNCTFTFSGATSGKACSFTLILRQDSGGGNTVTWPSSVKWPGGTAPTISSGSSEYDVYSFLTVDGGTTWLGFIGGQAFA